MQRSMLLLVMWQDCMHWCMKGEFILIQIFELSKDFRMSY